MVYPFLMGTTSRATGHAVLGEIAKVAAGVPAGSPTSWSSAPLAHRVENMTTRCLERRRGALADGTPWSVVVKTLQPASAHPAFAQIPEAFHDEVLEDLDWRDEPHVYASGLGPVLPAPLRMPTVFAIVEDAPDQVSVWMEDVDDVAPWDLARYHRTAEALGALAGSWPGEEAAAAFRLGGRDIGRLFSGKVLHHDLALLADDGVWTAPPLARLVDPHHRRDLHRLADEVPGLLAAMAAVPAGVCHGDATPDNFREPGDGTVVALDWSYGHVGPVGSDLGQLVAGRFESGAAGQDDVDAVAATVLDGYLAGLERVRCEVDPRLVRLAFAVHLAVRSAFSALHLDHRGDITDDERRHLLGPRVRLSRFAIDLARSQADGGAATRRSGTSTSGAG